MPVLAIAIAAGIALLALCIGTAWLVLRPAGRARVSRWSSVQLLAALVAACVPWLIVRVWRMRITVSIHSIGPLLGWLLLALCVFAVLVLLPLAVLLAAIVWLRARRVPAGTGRDGT